ncbi:MULTISPECIES: hypothetical protein [unclassified Streptomyces]|uniref:hypothetical protein n=1 Tax=unclassified Streptomyces TaxID=2593676 RepID=UPI002E36D55A|nr:MULTISPECIES: hypothetical protein [unclassified Streptomyces]
MLTYHEVMSADLGLLTTAAGKWDEMAGELKKVETRYGDSVQKITMGPDWSGVSVGVAHSNFAATRYEYSPRSRPGRSRVCCAMPIPSSPT